LLNLLVGQKGGEATSVARGRHGPTVSRYSATRLPVRKKRRGKGGEQCGLLERNGAPGRKPAPRPRRGLTADRTPSPDLRQGVFTGEGMIGLARAIPTRRNASRSNS